MLKTIKMAALAATVCVTGMSFSGPSVAQDVEFLIGPDGLRMRTRDYCERNRSDRRRCGDYWDRRRGDDGPPRFEGGRRRVCDTRDAVDKARDMGLRRARVIDAGRRTVEVAGMSRRGRVVITFGRQPGCPVLDRDYRG